MFLILFYTNKNYSIYKIIYQSKNFIIIVAYKCVIVLRLRQYYKYLYKIFFQLLKILKDVFLLNTPEVIVLVR